MATIYHPQMLPVTIPRFASQQPQQQGGAPPQSSSAMGEGADPLDFDLLAEYLLDDTAAVASSAPGMPQFDFSEATAGSGVVSPEQSEDGFPPIGEAAPAPAPIAARVSVPAPAPMPSVPVAPPGSHAPQQPLLAPAPPAMVARTTHAPAPVMHLGMPVPQSFPTLPTAVPGAGMAPPAQGLVLHHHGVPPQPAPVPTDAPGAKRKRVDMPTQVIAAGSHPMMAAAAAGHLMPHGAIPGRGRQKTQAQIDRRRERNRILARRTRLRKKFFFESLQKDVTDLQRENAILKDLVRKKLNPEDSKKLLAECNAMEQLPSAVQEFVGEGGMDIDSQDFNLVRSIQRSQQCFVISDPSLQDNPIVYASDDFLTLTGYQREDVLGRNCRFLQGTETSAQKVEQVRKAISMGEDVTVTMINYTADGTAFWNKLFVAALRDAQNNIVNFIGVVVKVGAPDPDDPEAGKRLPGEQAASPSGGVELDGDDIPETDGATNLTAASTPSEIVNVGDELTRND